MVSVLASSTKSRWIDKMPGQIQPNTLKFVFPASPRSMHHLGVRSTTGRPRVGRMCLGKVACLPVDLLCKNQIHVIMNCEVQLNITHSMKTLEKKL